MGCDKADLILDQRTFLAIAVGKLRPLADRIFLVGGPHRFPETRTLEDLVPDAGPLGGILTVLCSAGTDRVLIMAVDLPLLRKATLQGLARAAKNADITLVCTPDGRKHPLCAVYSKRCIEPIRTLLLSGSCRVEKLLGIPGLAVRLLTCEELGCCPEEMTNVNTREDLDRVQRLQSTCDSYGPSKQ